MALRILLRRGTTAEWIATNPVPSFGEPCVEIKTDGTLSLKIGDGETNWQSLKEISGDTEEILAITGNLVSLNTSDKTNLVAAINSIIASKGQAAGLATLNNSGKIPTAQLPDEVLGQLLYGGIWNAGTAVATLTENAKSRLGTDSATITLSNNTAAITGYAANEGIYYVTQTAGTFADIRFNVGDWLISTGAGWDDVRNSDAVTGVKGNAESSFRTGNVNLTAAQIGAEPAIPTKNTAFNVNFGTTARTAAQGNDSRITGAVQATGNQTIGGTKTFSTSPVVPNKTTAATNTGTAVATEAQVYAVAQAVAGTQNALSAQQLVNIDNVPDKLDKNLGAALAGQVLIVGTNGDIITTDTINGGEGSGETPGGGEQTEIIFETDGSDGELSVGGNFSKYKLVRFHWRLKLWPNEYDIVKVSEIPMDFDPGYDEGQPFNIIETFLLYTTPAAVFRFSFTISSDAADATRWDLALTQIDKLEANFEAGSLDMGDGNYLQQSCYIYKVEGVLR